MRFTSSLKLKLIYVFRINDAAHHGCLKIGEATCEDENVFGLSPNSKALNEAAKKLPDAFKVVFRIGKLAEALLVVLLRL